jgi:hypothetical protein
MPMPTKDNQKRTPRLRGWIAFSLLTTQPYVGVTDFSAVWVPNQEFQGGAALLLAAVVGNTVNALFGVPGSIGPDDGEAYLGTFEQAPFREGPWGVILFASGTTALNCWIDIQANGAGWVPAPIAPLQWAPRASIISVVAVHGNPFPTIQALLLVRPPGLNQPQGSGTPYLLWNVSQWTEEEQGQVGQGNVPDNIFGASWQGYGVLPNNVTPVASCPTCSTMLFSGRQ